MKQSLAILGLLITAFAWLTPTVTRILELIWPVIALAFAAMVIALALAVCLRLLAPAVRGLMLTPVAQEVFPRPPLSTFAREVADVFSQDDEVIHRDRWAIEVERFGLLGDYVGFSVRQMEGYLTRSKRQIFVDLLRAEPHAILISDNESTRWAKGWSRRGLRAALKHGLLELPYPTGDPPAVPLVKPGTAYTAYSAYTPNTPNTPGQIVIAGPRR